MASAPSTVPFMRGKRFIGRLGFLHRAGVGPNDKSGHRSPERKLWFTFGLTCVLLAIAAWTDDTFTLQGERTIYTVQCLGGLWVNDWCTGRLAAAERLRFRVPPTGLEVFFWEVGGSDRVRRLAPCEIQDGRNWVCTASPSMIVSMVEGKLKTQPESGPLHIHAVSKLTWLRLKLGSLTARTE